jgi:His/Glu/Gln/Arg/opine family amino acid ABC transporter permease subunit
VRITLGAFALGCAIGLALASVRAFVPNALLRAAIAAYVEIFRGVPALAQLFISYFGLAYVGIKVDAVPAAIVGLGLISGAYMSEIFRAGFAALHQGQREAALAVGMTPAMALRYIILPQGWRIVLPPLANYAIGLLKDTSVVSAIAAPEIMFYARTLVTATYQATTIYILAALLYLALSLPLAHLADRLERRRRTWS